MPVSLPPLQTLRAFEAAARHLSYSRAAEELHLTHGAISHQIKALEERLQTRLFRRQGHRMLLTDDGQVLVLKIRQGLRLLERAFEESAADRWRLVGAASPLTVSVLPAFAARWLIPRLPDFQAAHPEIDVNLRPTQELATLDGDGVDLAIRYGPGSWPGLQHAKLMDEFVFPVCSPHYRGGDLPRIPADLAGATLLRNPWQPWEPWFNAAGLDLREPQRGPSFAESTLLLQAAIGGQGVALARGVLVEEDLRACRLVRLFDIAVRDTYGYFVVWRAGARKEATIATFRDWLLSQAGIDA